MPPKSPVHQPSASRSDHHSETSNLVDTPSNQTLHKSGVRSTSQTAEAQHTDRQIEYRCSEAPTAQIPLLGGLLFDAVQSSRQWLFERDLGGSTTDCLNALVPRNRGQDVSITLLVGHEKGLELIGKFQLAMM